MSIYVFYPSNQTPLIKPLVRLSVLGVSSSVATGIGAWRFVEKAYPTADSQLSANGFKRNIPTPNLSADVATGRSTSGEAPFKFQSYGCFQNFFPGANMKHDILTEEAEESFSQSLPTNLTSSINPIGCALLDLSYSSDTITKTVGETKENVQEIKYIFKSEITVKNDKFGWSLWTGVKSFADKQIGSTGTNQKLIYYLVFLTKNSSDSNWSVKGGYSWMDENFKDERFHPLLHLVPPTGKNWYESIKKHNQNDQVSESLRYSGAWEASNTGNEVFQDIEVWVGNDDDKSEVTELLGRPFKKDSSRIDFNVTKTSNDYGYKDATHIYVPNSGWKEWKTKKGSSSKDITQTLQTLYAPFSGKRGKWREMQEYCGSQSFTRGSGYLYRIQNFCYRK